MKNEKIFLIFLCVFCIGWGAWGLKKQLARYESSEEILFEVPPQTRDDRFFHFSPAEQYILEMRKEIWPGIFNAKNPLTPASLPLVYRKYMELERGPELSTFEILELRQWSMLANSEHKEALKAMLLEGLEKEKSFKTVLNAGNQRSNEPCSLRAQDRAYRLIQVDVFTHEAESFLQQCNPKSLDPLWFEVMRQAAKREPVHLDGVMAKLKEWMSETSPQESFRRWSLMELFNLAHILETRSGNASAPEKISVHRDHAK